MPTLSLWYFSDNKLFGEVRGEKVTLRPPMTIRDTEIVVAGVTYILGHPLPDFLIPRITHEPD